MDIKLIAEENDLTFLYKMIKKPGVPKIINTKLMLNESSL